MSEPKPAVLGEGSLAEGLGLGLLGPGCDPHISVSRTFAPLWEVFRVSSDKLALCHLELTRKLQDLIKDVLRHGEEQLKAHKKVSALVAAGPVGGERLWLLGSQDFWALEPQLLVCAPEGSVNSMTSNSESHRPEHC